MCTTIFLQQRLKRTINNKLVVSFSGYEWKYKCCDCCEWWDGNEATLNQEYESSEKRNFETNLRLGQQNKRSSNGEFFALFTGWLHLIFYHTKYVDWYFFVQVLENFIPPLLDAVLLDYQKTNVHCAREPEVLSAMATIVNKLEAHITSEVPKIFDAVFECTLEMINKDFEEFPEHRTNFFLLLQVIKDRIYY